MKRILEWAVLCGYLRHELRCHADNLWGQRLKLDRLGLGQILFPRSESYCLILYYCKLVLLLLTIILYIYCSQYF